VGTTLATGQATAEVTAGSSETVAVVTAGARGFGRYLCGAFASAGYHVVVTATATECAERAAAEIVDATGAAVTGVGLRTDDIDSVKSFRVAVGALEPDTGRRLQERSTNAGRIEKAARRLW